jgi:hypothetical protein
MWGVGGKVGMVGSDGEERVRERIVVVVLVVRVGGGICLDSRR